VLHVFHAPVWVTWLILAALPVILGAVLYFFGEDGPDNMIQHYSSEDDEPPDGSDGEPDDLLAAA
jgi:hypothetical protein